MNALVLICASVESTLAAAERIIQEIESDEPGAAVFMAHRQGSELAKYIAGYRDSLRARLEALQQKRDGDSKTDTQAVNELRGQQFVLEEALQFTQSAFVEPRRKQSANRSSLDMADWFCISGFQACIAMLSQSVNQTTPVGPLVALAAGQTPAVWAPHDTLPIPSLFAWNARRVRRDGDGALGRFPLICLPTDVARIPAYYPLLSHEVGHTVDSYMEIESKVFKELAGISINKVWKGWLRELIADAYGLILSGESFVLALANFTQYMEFGSKGSSSVYPPRDLRLAILGASLIALGRDGEVANELIANCERQNALLLAEYKQGVHEAIYQRVFGGMESWKDAWQEKQRVVAQVARDLSDDPQFCWTASPSHNSTFSIRDAVSAISLAGVALDRSMSLLKSYRAAKQGTELPDWVQNTTELKFSVEVLPSLRHTILGPDGRTKLPPPVLFASYDSLALVGATHGQLDFETHLKSRDGKSWKKIELFFAGDQLMAQVYRDPPDGTPWQDDAQRLAYLIHERDESNQRLGDQLRSGNIADEWAIYIHEGAAIFASYWDWERVGGRIHISTQLQGIDLRRCPGTDYLWMDTAPSQVYRQYCEHLDSLRRHGTYIACNASIRK